eukprot:TRINITY_DN103463_c0_g1_i1.p1 TRINITY_DN103463_c0_g1~~TRINITY_DN103463_c0_g1_i1.p1  ORF type:complete len:419 (-),score=102.03 TRINITY_DN103463_c0_g1_i1:334-1590(-)
MEPQLGFSDVFVSVAKMNGALVWGPFLRPLDTSIKELHIELITSMEEMFLQRCFLVGSKQLADSDTLRSALLVTKSSCLRADPDPNLCPTMDCIRVPGHDGPCQMWVNNSLEYLPSAFCLELSVVAVGDRLTAQTELIERALGVSDVRTKLLLAGGNAHRAGYTVERLRSAGIRVQQLQDAFFFDADLLENGAGFDVAHLSGVYGIADLKDAGFSAMQLLRFWTPRQLRYAGFSFAQLQDAGLNLQELQHAGFHAREFKIADLKHAGFDVAKLREQRFNLGQLKHAGFGAAELKDAGVVQLTEVGFRAADLGQAGFGIHELKQHGFNARQLRAAGFGARQLKAAGFNGRQLIFAGLGARELIDVGCMALDLKVCCPGDRISLFLAWQFRMARQTWCGWIRLLLQAVLLLMWILTVAAG